MLIGLTGFHGSGKSFLANIMSDELKWNLVNKRSVLQKMHGKNRIINDLTWEEWYRALYIELGAFRVMSMILEELNKDNDGIPIIIDSVHNSDEWRAVKHFHPKAILIGVFSPKRVRFARNDQGDDELDAKRLIYWHGDVLSNFSCLLSEVEWSFSGCDPINLQICKCYALRDYLKKEQLI